MKYRSFLIALLPATALAGPFDGTWVTKPESLKITGKPDKYLLTDGKFTCGPCYPTYTIPADGSDQAVQGHAYYDRVSVKVIDDHTVQLKNYAGSKIYADRTYVVSADGNKLTEQLTDYEGPTPEKATLMATRIAPAPAGAHALSGSWKPDETHSTLPPEFLTVTLVESSDGLKMSMLNGQSYDAKFDGKPVPIVGDAGKTMASVKHIDARTIEETDTRDGKIVDVTTSKLSSDGKSMSVVDKDHVHELTTTFTAVKQ